MPKFIVDLELDGYDTKEEMEEACVEFIYEQLNMTASSVAIKAISDSVLSPKEQHTVDLITEFGGIDGGHHKQWLLDQIIREILGNRYEDWVKEYDGEEDEYGDTMYEWDCGIAP